MRCMYFWDVYYAVWKEVMHTAGGDVFWSDWSEVKCKLFVGLVNVFTYKTSMMLNNTAVVAYSVHIVLLNSSAAYWLRFFENVLTLMVILPAKMDCCKESELSGKGMVNFAHCLFTGSKVVRAEVEITPLRHVTPNQSKIGCYTSPCMW